MATRSKMTSALYDSYSELARVASEKARAAGHLVDGDAEGMSDQELLDVMANLGIECSKADLDGVVAACTGTSEVFRSLTKASGVNVEDYDADDVMYCLIELCRRWYPDWVSTDNLDDLMQEGYDYFEEHKPQDLLPGLAIWERAWEVAKALRRKWGVRCVDEFDDGFFWGTQSLHNWVQDYETALLNVTFFNLGDERMHDDFVRDFAKEFPADVMGVLGFMVDDDGTLVKTIIDEEGDWPIDESWDADYASELGWISSADPDPYNVPTFAPAPKHEPIRVQKVGRNEPCPCGSGKKYKKCCGRHA